MYKFSHLTEDGEILSEIVTDEYGYTTIKQALFSFKYCQKDMDNRFFKSINALHITAGEDICQRAEEFNNWILVNIAYPLDENEPDMGYFYIENPKYNSYNDFIGYEIKIIDGFEIPLRYK